MNHDVLVFLAGSAVGAVTAGLIVHISEKSSRAVLEAEVQEALRAAARADAAALRASAHEGRPQDVAVVEPQNTPTVEPRAKRGASSVRSVLQQRLGARVFEDMPVIDRGVERLDSTADISLRPRTPVAPAAAGRRTFDPQVRASIIDRRLPRFDESLFPDTTTEAMHHEDDFETAMRAMEEVTPEFSDASSYIDYLVEDEMRRNKSEAGRRYSRQHLTVFEGTGDLTAARRALRNRAKHLPSIALEA